MVMQNGVLEARTATVVIRFKAEDGTWKRASAVRGANGRIRPGHALMEGKPKLVGDSLVLANW